MLAPQPKVADARLSLIHVADLAETLALALDRPPSPSTYEIDDGWQGGYSYADMATAAAAALGRRARTLQIARSQMMAVARLNLLRQSLGGSTQILIPAKVKEMFHRDWTIHDRRLASAVGFRDRYDLAEGFRHTVLWYRAQGWL